jgi:nucleoside 2-deoxyribosyltransferase
LARWVHTPPERQTARSKRSDAAGRGDAGSRRPREWVLALATLLRKQALPLRGLLGQRAPRRDRRPLSLVRDNLPADDLAQFLHSCSESRLVGPSLIDNNREQIPFALQPKDLHDARDPVHARVGPSVSRAHPNDGREEVERVGVYAEPRPHCLLGRREAAKSRARCGCLSDRVLSGLDLQDVVRISCDLGRGFPLEAIGDVGEKRRVGFGLRACSDRGARHTLPISTKLGTNLARWLQGLFGRSWPPIQERGERAGDVNGRLEHFARPKPLRVYLAGRYARREELRGVASELKELGFNVTSRWLSVDASIPGGLLAPSGRAAEIARMDFDDVQRADVCIAFTEPADGPQGRGGRHTELGITLALGQRVMIVGPREHVFHCLAEVSTTWTGARRARSSPQTGRVHARSAHRKIVPRRRRPLLRSRGCVSMEPWPRAGERTRSSPRS